MLPARATEALQGECRRILAARKSHFLDRGGHRRDGDGDKTLCNVARIAAHWRGQFGEFGHHHRAVQPLVATRPEHCRKMRGLDLAEQHVGVGNCQRPAATVCGRPRIGPGALWPRAQPCAIEAQNRTAARRHRLDRQHRHTQVHPGDLRIKLALKRPGIKRDVGRSPAHIEGDNLRLSRLFRRSRRADNSACRAREDRILGAEPCGLCQPSVRLHKGQRHPRQLGAHRFDIAAQHRREVGVNHARPRPCHQPEQWADLVAR